MQPKLYLCRKRRHLFFGNLKRKRTKSCACVFIDKLRDSHQIVFVDGFFDFFEGFFLDS